MEFPKPIDNNQINFLKIKFPNLFKSLVNFCCNKTENKRDVLEILNNKKLDSDIYNDLYTIYSKNKQIKQNTYNTVFTPEEIKKRSELRIADIKNLIHSNFKPKKILDFGLGDGDILLNLKNYYSLEKEDVIGVDVNPVITTEFTFLKDTSKIPSDSVDLIVCLMVLHHMESDILPEFNRILKKDGIVVIREHDCTKKETALYIDIIHGMYSSSMSYPRETATFKDTYFADYQTRGTFRGRFKNSGFELISGSDVYGVQRSYYESFKKIN